MNKQVMKLMKKKQKVIKENMENAIKYVISENTIFKINGYETINGSIIQIEKIDDKYSLMLLNREGSYNFSFILKPVYYLTSNMFVYTGCQFLIKDCDERLHVLYLDIQNTMDAKIDYVGVPNHLSSEQSVQIKRFIVPTETECVKKVLHNVLEMIEALDQLIFRFKDDI
mgnify:FL=1